MSFPASSQQKIHMNIAVIPARGGSKRIPRKNIKLFAGKPMISYAIKAAFDSSLFERIIVTTDDDEIAEIAVAFGAEVPFRRPLELADDHTPTVPVIVHAINECSHRGWQAEKVCCIYPNVPFIEVEDIRTAYDLLGEKQTKYTFPVTEFPSAIQRALRRSSTGAISPFFEGYELTRTQDLERAYHDAGQFYWGSASAWLKFDRIHANGIGLVIPNWRVVDIDTPEDWHRAETLWAAFGPQNTRKNARS